MAGAQHGRHRVSKPSRAVPRLVALGAVAVAAAVFGGFMVFYDSDTDTPVRTPEPSGNSVASPTTLQATRVVEVHQEQVTVSESTKVMTGSPITIKPSIESPPLGLAATRSVVVSETGSDQKFDGAITVDVGRSVTVESTYRLTSCPDLLPTQWPSLVSVASKHWSRTFTRIEEPQRTARALCSRSESKAEPLRGLKGVVQRGRVPAVRLIWSGPKPLTVHAVGSATGVAAIGKGRPCGHDCVAVVRSGDASRLRIRPLEHCSVGGRTNLLTLRVSIGHGSPRTIALSLAGLARSSCRAAGD